MPHNSAQNAEKASLAYENVLTESDESPLEPAHMYQEASFSYTREVEICGCFTDDCSYSVYWSCVPSVKVAFSRGWKLLGRGFCPQRLVTLNDLLSSEYSSQVEKYTILPYC